MDKKYLEIRKNRKTAYVIVHPDEYAFSVSQHIPEPEKFKVKIKKKIKTLIESKVNVIILNLDRNIMELPEFINEFYKDVYVIPNLKNDSPESQSIRLRKRLIEVKNIENIIFSGGWKNACFKHTLNYTLLNLSKRIRSVDDLQIPFKTKIHYGDIEKEVMVEIDHEFLF